MILGINLIRAMEKDNTGYYQKVHNAALLSGLRQIVTIKYTENSKRDE